MNKKRIEIHITEDQARKLQKKANDSNRSRKNYCEHLVLKDIK